MPFYGIRLAPSTATIGPDVAQVTRHARREAIGVLDPGIRGLGFLLVRAERSLCGMAKRLAKVDTNALGDRGESIFLLRVGAFHGKRPLFRTAALGQKWPVADFAVELVGKPGRFFLVQVKATQKAITPAKKRLPIDVKSDRVKMLIGSPIPAYIVAVHEPTEEAFLIAPRTGHHVHNIATTFSLGNKAVRVKLHREVANFWAGVTSPFSSANSVFVD